jgi:hypothetical protein
MTRVCGLEQQMAEIAERLSVEGLQRESCESLLKSKSVHRNNETIYELGEKNN